MKSHLLMTAAFVTVLAPAALRAQTAAPGNVAVATAPPAADPAAPGAAPAEDIIVTGTRQLGRTKAESPAPVDVISAAELQRSGQQNVFDALNVILPSFDLPAFGSDTSGLVRSARLRGLSPDDVLVLVDGKRRHVSANLNTDIGPAGGSDPVDFDTIPISLIDHIEVLRDGAAAQYGSDAIAGVINIILKHATQGGAAYAQEGAFYQQDGFTNNLGTSYALPIGDNGYFDLGFDYRYHDHTNRDGAFPSDASLGHSTVSPPLHIPSDISQIEGDPRYNLLTGGYNAAYTFSPEAQLYSFATIAYRHSEAFENFRDPNINGNYNPGSNLIPGTTIPAPYNNLTAAKYFPNGFIPVEANNEYDYSFTAGLKGDVLGDWHYDLSSTYGGDIENISDLNTINGDFLHVFGYSPTHFHDGEFNDTEWTSNLDISKPFDVPIFAKPLNVAVGAEYRRDSYAIQAGDAAAIFEGSSSGYAGFSKQDAGYYARSNEAIYGDLATNPTENWQVDLAGRFEHYSDFGNTETGKFTTRYDITPWFALRGTISNGFRAPSLAQEGYSGVNVGPNSASGALPVNSPGALLLGSRPLKPERSQNYEVGFVAQPIERVHVALDVYQIDIRDQIVDSGSIGGANSIQAFELDGFSIPTGVTASEITATFFTNGVNTRTRGADLTVDYTTLLNNDGRINWLLAGNINNTVITRIDPAAQLTPDVISEIQNSTPKSKVLVQAVYINDPFSVTLRETRFGQVVEAYSFEGSGGPPFTTNRNKPHFISDIELGYKITKDVTFTLGANNLFDTYADHSTVASRIRNAEQYIAASPYGIDGGFYYARLNVKWGGVPPAMPEPPPVAPTPAPAATVPVRTYLVFFDWDRADLTARARQIVLAAAQASTQVQTTRLEVNGYTDLSGTAAYNQKLSVRRAQTVQSELVKDGVAPGEIFIHGYGESSPLIQTAPGVREPQNRRVEIVLK